MNRLLAAAAMLTASIGLVAPAAAQSPSHPVSSPRPPIRHVIVLNLENESYTATFGPTSPATYLTTVLRPRGVLLTQYYGIAHNSAPNYIAEISGQGPNVETQADCQVYDDFVGVAGPAPAQAVGQGCVYPASVPTLPDELDASGLTWKAYMEDMGNDPARESSTCGHPALNSRDGTQTAEVGDQYATRHDPFVYFHSIIDSPTCQQDVVPFTRFQSDVASVRTTPNVSFITPNLCDDGHDNPCVDGQVGGLASADQWLKTWVPKILASPAYKQDGMVVITFDEAESGGLGLDATACCHEAKAPNVAEAGDTGPGGGRVGALVLSRFVKPGSTTATPYNHYSLLCSLENTFGLAHLGYAATPGLACFGKDVYQRR